VKNFFFFLFNDKNISLFAEEFQFDKNKNSRGFFN